ncbi:LINE-1 retrotransposable element ORF2 protein [Cucumis melo var. makuwa]|uniref:LINE-1 retrotransposable element ORF2 protein n=1 Tax=Cucumis melo var. makuwa TaxID=1194695 RepID=A0A5D3BR42_CUCMM|nr:LINE-1 retrotransposable element ORF2 protein [Cucumis melo var. makuwa]
MNKGWATYGPLTLKLEWNPKIHGRMLFVPSYGGWIKLRNFPQHLWNEEIFKKVGDMLRGFINYTKENSSLIDCVEVAIKVKGNYCGFVPLEFDLIDDPDSFLVQVASLQEIMSSESMDPSHWSKLRNSSMVRVAQSQNRLISGAWRTPIRGCHSTLHSFLGWRRTKIESVSELEPVASLQNLLLLSKEVVARLLEYDLCIRAVTRKGKSQRKGGSFMSSNKKLIKEVKALLGSWEREAQAAKACTSEGPDDFLVKFNPDVVILQESKVSVDGRKLVKSVWGSCLVGCGILEACGSSGGILLMWKEESITVISSIQGQFPVSILFKTNAGFFGWITDCRGALLDLIVKEQKIWIEKCNLQWPCEGEENYSFFHRWISARKSKSIISLLMSIDGQALVTKKEIVDEILSLISSLYGTKTSFSFICDGFNWKTLGLHASSSLEAPFSEKEIRDAVFEMGCLKSPGPDGFGRSWRRWIWGCLLKTNFWIIVNGSPREKIFAKRGIHQAQKTSLIGINLDSTVLAPYASTLGYVVDSIAFNYLGFSIGGGRNRKEVWNALEE